MRKIGILALILFILGLAYLAVENDWITLPTANGENTGENGNPDPGPITSPEPDPGTEPNPEPEIRTATLAAAGGAYPHDVVINEAHVGGGVYDFTPSFEFIAPYFKAADLAMINLETMQAGPDLQFWGVSGYTGHEVAGIYTFNAPLSLSEALKDAGVNMYVMANNHSMDRGLEGLKVTLENVRSLGFFTAGAYLNQEERDTPDLLDLNGIKVGFVSYTFSTNGLPIPEGHEYAVNFSPFFEDLSPFIADVKRTREAGADIVVAMPHWGEEYNHEPSPQQRDIARRLAEAGADIVLGGHPHVLQPMEWIYTEEEDGTKRPTMVVYSTGNFYSNQYYPRLDTDMVEYGLLVNIELSKNMSDGTAWISDAGYEIYWSHFAWRHRLLVVSEVLANGPEGYNIDSSRYQILQQRYQDNKDIIERYGFSENKPF